MEHYNEGIQCNYCDKTATHAYVVIRKVECHTLDENGDLLDFVGEISEEVEFDDTEYTCDEHCTAVIN